MWILAVIHTLSLAITTLGSKTSDANCEITQILVQAVPSSLHLSNFEVYEMLLQKVYIWNTKTAEKRIWVHSKSLANLETYLGSEEIDYNKSNENICISPTLWTFLLKRSKMKNTKTVSISKRGLQHGHSNASKSLPAPKAYLAQVKHSYKRTSVYNSSSILMSPRNADVIDLTDISSNRFVHADLNLRVFQMRDYGGQYPSPEQEPVYSGVFSNLFTKVGDEWYILAYIDGIDDHYAWEPRLTFSSNYRHLFAILRSNLYSQFAQTHYPLTIFHTTEDEGNCLLNGELPYDATCKTEIFPPEFQYPATFVLKRGFSGTDGRSGNLFRADLDKCINKPTADNTKLTLGSDCADVYFHHACFLNQMSFSGISSSGVNSSVTFEEKDVERFNHAADTSASVTIESTLSTETYTSQLKSSIQEMIEFKYYELYEGFSLKNKEAGRHIKFFFGDSNTVCSIEDPETNPDEVICYAERGLNASLKFVLPQGMRGEVRTYQRTYKNVEIRYSELLTAKLQYRTVNHYELWTYEVDFQSILYKYKVMELVKKLGWSDLVTINNDNTITATRTTTIYLDQLSVLYVDIGTAC